MTAKALGIIEAIGLAAAIEAADTAAKAANVVVLGYENAKGGGRITVKLAGDVGAVKAAVSAGSAAALRVGKVAGCLVIPRPHQEIAGLIAAIDRGRRPGSPAPLTPAPSPSEPPTESEPERAVVAAPVAEPASQSEAEPAVEPSPAPPAPLLLAPPRPAPAPERGKPAARRGKPSKSDPQAG